MLAQQHKIIDIFLFTPYLAAFTVCGKTMTANRKAQIDSFSVDLGFLIPSRGQQSPLLCTNKRML
jgi:hypothetical protein